MCTYITKLVTNHAPIDKYRFRFFPEELFAYLYGDYPIEMRRHILFKYT